ncbi:transcriptional regulator [Citrobacter freundii]|nr:transcriptional regulator [Citrobacter freundii]
MTNPPQTEYPVYANRHNNEQIGRPLPPDVEKRTRFAMGNNILLSMKDITAHSGLSDKLYFSLIKRELFPRPLKIGRSSRWRRSDYEAWLNERDTSRK